MPQSNTGVKPFSIKKEDILKALNLAQYYRSELGVDLVSRNGDGWTENVSCPFPFHDDSNPSFGVNLTDGRFKCFSCGEKGDIFAFQMKRNNQDFPTAIIALADFAGISSDGPPHKKEWTLQGEWTYQDANGKPYRKIERRFDGKRKQYPQYRWEDNKWLSGTKNQPPIPYRLPELLKSKYAFIPEGEKCVDALCTLNLFATTNPGGASKWDKNLNQYFSHLQEVFILPDNDEPGRKHGLDVAKNLYGIVKSIKIVILPDLPEKGDVVDFLAKYTDKEEAVDAIGLTVSNAPAWTPEAEEPKAENQSLSRFKLSHVGELVVKAAVYLIKGLLEADCLALIFGDPGTFKSFLAIAWACCITTGTAFMGRAVKSGPVVYIAGEGQNGLARRFNAWAIRNRVSLKDAPLFVSLMPAGLCDADQAQFVIDAIDGIAGKHGEPVLIVVDTVARNFGPGDENSTKDMSGFIQACDAIRAKYQATVLLVHHSGHGDKTRARGAMALKGALDAEYRTDIDEVGIIRFEATKMKDSEFPAPMAFRAATVELGIVNEVGEAITSVVLDETEYEPRAKQGKEGRGRWQTVAFEALEALTQEQQRNLINGGYDSDTTRVSVEDWRDACLSRGMNRKTWWRTKNNPPEGITIQGGFVNID